MLGKGSVSHNSRQFKANNIDSDRTHLNFAYCNQPVKDVYHELFDGALRRYNEKQKRADRCIDDYYERIRTGKQEKLFYEVIFQVGNLKNMSAASEDGQLAATVLDQFMRDFQERNPYLKVFSAHLHMDEATPHLHVDFVPFTTSSKRGLDTRVSLKQALANQGFVGGARGDTEWNQWVKSEKEQLARVMERHGIEWEQLGTHDEHLSVMDYKKVQRAREVAALEAEVSEKQEAIAQLDNKAATKQAELTKQTTELSKVQATLATAKTKKKFVALNARQYDDDPKYELPEPTLFMSAKSYRDNIASTLVGDLKDAIRSILLQFFDKTQELQRQLDRANEQIQGLARQNSGLKQERDGLSVSAKNFRKLRQYIGAEKTDEIIRYVEQQELAQRPQRVKSRELVR
jgi:hypothetical protein